MRNIHISATVSPHARIYTTRLKIGECSRIDDGVILTGDVEIGKYVHIACYGQLHGGSGIRIDDYVGLSARAVLLSESDDFTGEWIPNPCVPEEFRKVTKGRIHIGVGAVIGVGCTFLPGVIVEKAVSIGAHSLVRDRLMEGGIYAGVPAKRIGTRKDGLMEKIRAFEAA